MPISHFHQLHARVVDELAVVEFECEHAALKDLKHNARLAEEVLRCGLQAITVRDNQRAAPGLARISRAFEPASHSCVAGGVILLPVRKHRCTVRCGFQAITAGLQAIDAAIDVRIGDVW